MKSHVTVLSIITAIMLILNSLLSVPMPPTFIAIATGLVAVCSLFKKKLLSSSGNLVSNTSPYANYIFYAVNGFYFLWMALGIFYSSTLIPAAFMTKAAYIYLVLNVILRQYFQDAIIVDKGTSQS